MHKGTAIGSEILGASPSPSSLFIDVIFKSSKKIPVVDLYEATPDNKMAFNEF